MTLADATRGRGPEPPGRPSLAPVSVALLAAVLLGSGCRGGKSPSGSYVRVLAWASNLAAGNTVAEGDISIVQIRQSLVDANAGLVTADDLPAVVGKVLARGVRRGDFVRFEDVADAPPAERIPTTSAPTTAPATGPYADLPVGDPAEVEPAGLYEKYVTIVRNARDEQLRDFPDDHRPDSPMPVTTQPLAMAGMTPLDADDPEVVVPEGSVRLYGFRHKVPGGLNDSFAYLVPGDMASVANFYQTTMPQSGYKGVKSAHRKGDVDREYLTFAKGGETVYFVNLHPADKGKVKVVLMISRLEQK